MPTPLEQVLQDLATVIGETDRNLLTLINGNVPDLDALTTTAKGNLVDALNEVRTLVLAGNDIIDDVTPSATSTFSSEKIVASIDTAIESVVGTPTVDLVAVYRAALA